MRTSLETILENASKETELTSLIEFWNQITKNKKQYPLSEIHEANRQIR